MWREILDRYELRRDFLIMNQPSPELSMAGQRRQADDRENATHNLLTEFIMFPSLMSPVSYKPAETVLLSLYMIAIYLRGSLWN